MRLQSLLDLLDLRRQREGGLLVDDHADGEHADGAVYVCERPVIGAAAAQRAAGVPQLDRDQGEPESGPAASISASIAVAGSSS